MLTLENNAIVCFKGQWSFLSNFCPTPNLEFPGLGKLQTVEHGYQALKCSDAGERIKCLSARTPGLAKKLGQRVKLRSNWDEIKLDVMRGLLRDKFKDPIFGRWLFLTGERELIEGNNWGDLYWGKCAGIGENWLGRLLMEIRKEIQDASGHV